MATWIVGGALAIIVGAIVFKMVRDKRNGKGGCSCNCGGCGGVQRLPPRAGQVTNAGAGGALPAPSEWRERDHATDRRADPLPAGAFVADAAGRGDRLQGRFPTVLGVSRPSVHRMLENLGNSGLTEKKPYGAVKLTEEGLRLAEELEGAARPAAAALRPPLRALHGTKARWRRRCF